MLPTNLKTEYLTSPLTIEVASPRFSWTLGSPGSLDRQTAFQVQAGTAAGLSDLWDSGKIASAATTQIAYAGTSLTAMQQVFWQVRVWDGVGQASAYVPGTFEMGLLASGDWSSAAYIQLATASVSILMRKAFTTTTGKTILRARLYVTAFGLYQPYVNGTLATLDRHTPAWSDFTKRVEYQAYDVTSLLTNSATNALAFHLGDGWMLGYLAVTGYPIGGGGNRAGTRTNFLQSYPALCCKLQITYTDATTQTIVSDTSWKTNAGFCTSNDYLQGEKYDARLYITGWNTAGFNDSAWVNPTAVSNTTLLALARTASIHPPVRTQETAVSVVTKTNPTGSVYVYDFGKVMAGHCQLNISGQSSGTVLSLRYGTSLVSGRVNTGNLTNGGLVVTNTDTYTCAGGSETWDSTFSLKAFRYVELTGYSGTPPDAALSAIREYSSADRTGTLAITGNATLNTLAQNCIAQYKINLQNLLHADMEREKDQWGGDNLNSAPGLPYVFNVPHLTSKILRDAVDGQQSGAFPDNIPYVNDAAHYVGSPNWQDWPIQGGWLNYVWYGDSRLISINYTALKASLTYQAAQLNASTLVYSGHKWPDFVAIEMGNTDLLAACTYGLDLLTMIKIANASGNTSDVAGFTSSYNTLKTAFLAKYDNGTVFSGSNADGSSNTQSCYVMALQSGFIPATHPGLTNRLTAQGGKLSTGFYGTQLLHVLSKLMGRPDLAYTAISASGSPSYFNFVTLGLTSFAELWAATSGGTLSHHYLAGAITQWLWEWLGGIQVDEAFPGLTRVNMQVYIPAGVTGANASLVTRFGTLSSVWTQGSSLDWTITVPPGMTARVYYPTSAANQTYINTLPSYQIAGAVHLGYDGTYDNFLLQAGTFELTQGAGFTPSTNKHRAIKRGH